MTNTKADFIKAQAAAHKIIEEFCITAPEEIDVEKISAARGLLVIEGPLEGADARLLRKGNAGVLRLKKGISEIGKKRFVIAHELGHWEMHKEQSQLSVIEDSDVKGYMSSPMELEATAFASELLMPSRIFRALFEDMLPDLDEIQKIAEKFQVTLTAAALRFVEETNHACFVVFSNNERIAWWKNNKQCEKCYWINVGDELNKQSYAWECSQQFDMELKYGDVPANLWFKSLKYPRDINEQSIKLGRYGTILTLLWIV